MASWKPVTGYEEMYLVSDEGNVKSLKGKSPNGRLLKQGKRGRGEQLYAFVRLCDNGTEKAKSVHKIVAEAFLPNPDGLPEINHKDENPLNNSVDNLEWCTRQYNIDYSKSKHIEQYTKDGIKIAEYKSISYAAEITGISRRAINNALCGWSNTAGNYYWRYTEKE